MTNRIQRRLANVRRRLGPAPILSVYFKGTDRDQLEANLRMTFEQLALIIHVV